MQKEKSTRLELLDLIRGFTIISMVLYHLTWDLVFIYGLRWHWFYQAKVWQQSICWTFIILSGFCLSLGRNLLKRGLVVFAAGLLVSAVTIFVTPHTRIIFGILTFIGSSMLLMIPLKKLFEKVPASLGLTVSFILFLLLKNCHRRHIGFMGLKILELPDFLYKNLFTTFLGFPKAGFFSSDYFPLLPWFFLFVFGFFLYRFLENKGMCEKLLSKGRLPVINFIGRHSLIIYLVHQPIIYGVCEIINLI